eukprot:3614104-Rhodomonas_salina.2
MSEGKEEGRGGREERGKSWRARKRVERKGREEGRGRQGWQQRLARNALDSTLLSLTRNPNTRPPRALFAARFCMWTVGCKLSCPHNPQPWRV